MRPLPPYLLHRDETQRTMMAVTNEAANNEGKSSTYSNSTSERSSVARFRWTLASQILRQHGGHDQRPGCKHQLQADILDPLSVESKSKRKFSEFGLFTKTELLIDKDYWIFYATAFDLGASMKEEVLSLKPNHDKNSFKDGIFIHFAPSLSKKDIQSFDNTGNICIWPCEEVLAYYCLKNLDSLREKKICELGGGMTCLAGNLIATCVNVEFLLLTDGNRRCVTNSAKIFKFNQARGLYKASNIGVRNLRWDLKDDWSELINTFDFVIAADCLFLAEYHSSLLDCLNNLLNSNGVAWIFAPKRGTTFSDFVKIAEVNFEIVVKELYDSLIWNLHQNFLQSHSDYIPDAHYPIFLTLRKKRRHRPLSAPNLLCSP